MYAHYEYFREISTLQFTNYKDIGCEWNKHDGERLVGVFELARQIFTLREARRENSRKIEIFKVESMFPLSSGGTFRDVYDGALASEKHVSLEINRMVRKN